MPDMLKPITQLEATPGILRALLDGLTPEQAQWKPAPDRFSIAEVIEHLSHTEAHAFRIRIQRMIDEDTPPLEEYDQNAYAAAGQYSGRDAEDSFDHWEEQREDNVEYLRSLPESAGARKAMHENLGQITVSEQLNEWAFHDLGHIRQIAEIVRTILFYPNMGPFRAEYIVKPWKRLST